MPKLKRIEEVAFLIRDLSSLYERRALIRRYPQAFEVLRRLLKLIELGECREKLAILRSITCRLLGSIHPLQEGYTRELRHTLIRFAEAAKSVGTPEATALASLLEELELALRLSRDEYLQVILLATDLRPEVTIGTIMEACLQPSPPPKAS